MSGVLVLGVLKWRSVLKQNSTAKAHHSPATPLRFRDKKNIKVYLLRMLDEVKDAKPGECFFPSLPNSKKYMEMSGLHRELLSGEKFCLLIRQEN